MLDIIKEQGIVAVLRADSHEQAREYMNACVKGGIKALELTYSIPNVNELIEEYKDNKDMIIGVGSVLNGKMAKDSILAGAKYVVSPGYNEEINDVCHEMGVTYFPGCMTVTEIMHALEKGNKMVKVFPGEIFGPKYIKAVKAPIPHVEIMPTGGVNIDIIDSWIKAGVDAVGIGGELNKLGEEGKFEEITAVCEQYMAKLNEARGC